MLSVEIGLVLSRGLVLSVLYGSRNRIDKEMAQSDKNSHSTCKTEVGKNLINTKVLILRKHIISRVSGYFPIGSCSVTQT